MKKTLLSLVFSASLFAMTSSALVSYPEQPFISGWNVFITNGATIGPNQLSNYFTLKNGQIVQGLTNVTINGTVNTNVFEPDAFNVNGVTLNSDLNGQITANAAIHWYINNTNLVSIAVTNSQGQYFILAGPTNSFPVQAIPAGYQGWPLAVNTGPPFMYPATTNMYPQLPLTNSATAGLTFYFQRGWRYPIGNGNNYTVWDSATNVFQFAVLPTGLPQSGITNLPTTFTQGANILRCSAIVMAGGTNCALINTLSLSQPTP